ncbi:glycosyltransferase [Mesorhizobium sp. BR115XR7A]|uniref:glycosyltransferase n=1 Tax=Mesorhizobium sp. BR115XR7A TaxID=2876645 RepID=UPI001CCE9635|nr:glycosyltransferase [Mesorhizobium sp. BR115XR7A]MBZ9909335.1 glycosyltransferase [Mesorhizobium sp. BR115XR7A]MBZ9932615.1 glycosyltransferase [Mesorhizobium sp. BR1-1-5]
MILPRISIIVPSYNQGRFLGECLESIVGQKYNNLELIVMDGGSTDESVSVIREFEAQINYWQSQPDGGQSAAINAGVARATGDVVAWLNSDDLYMPDTLHMVADGVERHPKYGLYIGNGLRLDERTGTKTPFTRHHIALNRRALKEGLDYILQPSVFFSREAWKAVGGLDPALRFSMDWDILIRIAERYPALAINEFLSISREYEETKTASGGMLRAAEIIAMTGKHSGKPFTVGGVLYFLESLLQPGMREELSEGTLQQIWRLHEQMRAEDLQSRADSRDGFPVQGDAGDGTYVQVARTKMVVPVAVPIRQWPRISVVIPSFNQAEFLERTLASIFAQNYPKLEVIVMDGGSTDGSVDILKRYNKNIAHWKSEKDRGPAHAINKGLARATGEVLTWLASDDMYAVNTLRTIGQLFAANPDLSLVVGNALYVDEEDNPKIMDHGEYKTALYYGVVQPRERVPAYWSYVHSIPQPSTFFTKSLLDRVGPLNESYHFIFDFELFFRMVSSGKTMKVEKTLSLYRIHSAAKTSDWNKFLVELYRFSRAWWPRWRDPGFKSTLRSFTVAFLNRAWGGRPRGWKFKTVAAGVALLAATRYVNVEKLAQRLALKAPKAATTHKLHKPRLAQPDLAYHKQVPATDPSAPLGSILFCSHFLPRYPGFSGGEIRDFHIIEELQKHSALSFAATSPQANQSVGDVLRPALDKYFDFSLIKEGTELPDLTMIKGLRSHAFTLSRALNRLSLTARTPRYHFDANSQLQLSQAYVVNFVRRFLLVHRPRFLVVSPQSNGIALLLEKDLGETRTIMASYDVESVRMERLAMAATGHRRLTGNVEAKRARNFERRNLALYDGVLAVSELDRSIFIERYGLDARRVAVVQNGVDTGYFAFEKRVPTELPAITFVASMGYEPNHLAAMRLIDRVMPLVWKELPNAQAWLVGQNPRPELIARSDGTRVFVTGAVESVRAYLRNAQAMCAPLTTGSGTKYKVLEALSAGIPSVCTSIAVEGLDIEADVHVKIADDDAGLACHIVTLLRDEQQAAQLALNGRALVESKYAWSVALNKLRPWLEDIAQMPKAKTGEPASESLSSAARQQERIEV